MESILLVHKNEVVDGRVDKETRRLFVDQDMEILKCCPTFLVVKPCSCNLHSSS